MGTRRIGGVCCPGALAPNAADKLFYHLIWRRQFAYWIRSPLFRSEGVSAPLKRFFDPKNPPF